MVTTNYGCDNDGDGDDGVGGDNDKYDINGSNNGDNNDDNKKVIVKCGKCVIF